MIKAFLIALLFASGNSALTQTQDWQPSPGHTQIPIWPGAAPNAVPVAGPETSTMREKDHLVAGKPWEYVERVSRPTLTVYSPIGKNTGAAVVVFPGGGYRRFAYRVGATKREKV